MNINEIIIIGGGSSISEGISLGLKEKIQDKCVLLVNYSFFHFIGTCLLFTDKNFYAPFHVKKNPEENPDIYEKLRSLPLIIGLDKKDGLKEFLLPNTYLIKCPKKEIPNPHLTGIFALSIAEKLNPKNIFLSGFDWSKQPIPEDKTKYNAYNGGDIHYYKKEISHRGIGLTGFYDSHNPDNYFKFFKDSKSKIYNVSLNSNIQNFEKISYEQMFISLSNEHYDQNELRNYTKEILCLQKEI